MIWNSFLLNLRVRLHKKYKNVMYVVAFLVLTLTSTNGYAQRSFGSDNIFVFDNFFDQMSFSSSSKGGFTQFLGKFSHELFVYGSAGISSLSGLGNGGLGTNFGVGYSIDFLPEYPAWSIYIGVEGGMYSSNVSYANKTYEYSLFEIPPYVVGGTLITPFPSSYLYRVTLEGATESGRAFLLNIPIMGRFKFPLDFIIPSSHSSSSSIGGYTAGNTDTHYAYAAAGVKIGIPLSGKYNNKFGETTISGFNGLTWQDDDDYGGDYDATKGELGFGEHPGLSQSGVLDSKLSVMLSLEAGYILPLNRVFRTTSTADQLTGYIGVYFDYGLNNSSPMANSPIEAGIINKSPVDMDINSPTYGKLHKPNFHSLTAPSAIHNMSLGLILRLSFTIPAAKN
ncbi:hypothetical protein FACS189452_06180 [Bacteroidia bacterium]|nr:hypothetical protein FACS189452_06180 [Bacteroidia bacterium]GHT80393.1 hypothetical protein FACS189467_2420 [Bacteroidia bacterium]